MGGQKSGSVVDIWQLTWPYLLAQCSYELLINGNVTDQNQLIAHIEKMVKT